MMRAFQFLDGTRKVAPSTQDFAQMGMGTGTFSVVLPPHGLADTKRLAMSPFGKFVFALLTEKNTNIRVRLGRGRVVLSQARLTNGQRETVFFHGPDKFAMLTKRQVYYDTS